MARPVMPKKRGTPVDGRRGDRGRYLGGLPGRPTWSGWRWRRARSASGLLVLGWPPMLAMVGFIDDLIKIAALLATWG